MIIPLNTAINASRLDPDALAFIQEANITDSVTIRALNSLCKSLKREDLWDSLYVAYPMVFTGFTYSQLLDLKTRTYLSIINPATGSTVSPTYSYSGIKYNGGQYHSTTTNFFRAALSGETPPGHISIYNRTNHTISGYTQSSGHGFRESIFVEQSIIFSTSSVVGSLWGTQSISIGNTNSSGFFIFSGVDDNSGFTASVTNPYNFYISRNGEILVQQTTSRNYQGIGSEITIGALVAGVTNPILRSFDEICWFSCGAGFSNGATGSFININKQEIFYDIVQKFQTSQGRQV